jgi:hypothetical protein
LTPVAAAILLLSGPAFAATAFWDNPAGGSFDTQPSNGKGRIAPAPTDDAVFNLGAPPYRVANLTRPLVNP